MRLAPTTLFCTLLLTCAQLPAAQTVQLVASPALSPDGTQLAFSWRGDVWTVPIEGGTVRPLTNHESRDSQPAYSPDGKLIAFISDRTGSDQVYVVGIEGGEPKQLTFHTEGYSIQEWYPDGQTILTSASRDHYWRHGERFFAISATQPQSGEQLLFDAYGDDASIAPDGKSILFTREGTTWWRKQYQGASQPDLAVHLRDQEVPAGRHPSDRLPVSAVGARRRQILLRQRPDRRLQSLAARLELGPGSSN